TVKRRKREQRGHVSRRRAPRRFERFDRTLALAGRDERKPDRVTVERLARRERRRALEGRKRIVDAAGTGERQAERVEERRIVRVRVEARAQHGLGIGLAPERPVEVGKVRIGGCEHRLALYYPAVRRFRVVRPAEDGVERREVEARLGGILVEM